ncbi:serum paraoxonase/arylesterase 1-like [Strongylocentrotus purpuratus]|uniref:Paraoxonase n=1 Tax=Strongylocentrotus purpuratus TaxID=7668 RepID=A0A7M7P044_STRPU|nr:serum paraoxonase/arylesterase 1 [Strongylocentrotus purpuratus]XP_030844073.1 serum paraoxonase/arylesterase 1-like [Strongylocentrotus purpuratus]|eukprot:XP_003726321.1 PREDICTED: serum paraoxonase/arylesterase 1 isoform X2 [Strongylocentrotus purpuratus]
MTWRMFVLSLLLALVFRHVFIVMKSLGFHKTVYNHRPGECTLVPGISNGSEDLELLSDGLVLISSGYPTLKNRVASSPRGHIYAFDLNDDDVKVKRLKITGNYDPDDFRPHGISSFEDLDTGRTFVLIVNHLVNDGVIDVIEIFELHRQSMTLKFIRTVNDHLMKSINDVVAVSKDTFYFTNDGRSLSPGIRLIEQLLRFRTGGIFYCDVTSCDQVGEPLLEPNGIQLSRDQRYVIVSQPFEERIQIYEREDWRLKTNKPIQSIHVGTAPDNVFVDDEGDLWLGCHPVGFRTLLHMEDTKHIAPSQVIRIKFNQSDEPYQSFDLEEIYSEDGLNISMSSSAVYYNNRLLVGTVRTGLLHCMVKAI